MARQPRKKAEQPQAETIAAIEGSITDVDLHNIVEEQMRNYGAYVVENRAVPDFRDGLKPVHRAILWSMYELSLHHNKPYKKSARTVGEAIGRFHPHGDMSTYGAMVTLANTAPALVEGYGNFGDHIEGAASHRYTEARLSKFSDHILLDPQYLAVVPKDKNFSGDCEWPRYLPAKLPVQLLIGSPTVPAFGVRAGNPPFAIDGVIKLVRAAVSGKTITPEHCLKYLQFNFRWGGECVSGDDELLEFFREGYGNLSFQPEFELDYAKKQFRILSVCPGFSSEATINTALSKVAELKGVTRAYDAGGSGKGKYNICYVVEFGRVSEDEMFNIAEKALKIVSGKGSFDLGYTTRNPKGATFGRSGVHEFINRWAKYRIALELAVLRHLIKEEDKKLARQELVEWAVLNRETVFDALNSGDPDAYLIKHGKVTPEFASEVLSLQVRTLAKLNLAKIREKKAEIKAQIKAYEKDHENPTPRLIAQLDSITKHISK